MFKLVKSETIPLTRELAEEFKAMTPASVEREFKPARAKALEDKANAGLLIPFNWARVKLPNGEIVRMNGQHSSNMLSGLNGAFPNGLFVHLDTFEVESDDDTVLLFRQYDPRESSRSAADVAGAYQDRHKDLEGVPRPPAKRAVEAYHWYRKNIVGISGVPRGDDRYDAFNREDLHDFITFVGDTIGKNQSEMNKEPVIAAMYATFDTNETPAREFWGIVAAGGDELNEDHPASVLSDWLIKVKKRELPELPKPAHLYQACIHAWNTYRTGAECKISLAKIKSAKGMYEPHA